jgi:hypothetical protein
MKELINTSTITFLLVCNIFNRQIPAAHFLSPDVQTLSRMTGKDFSGPIPEIRAPAPQITSESQDLDNNDSTIHTAEKRNSRRKTTLAGGQVIGDAETFDQSN